MKLFSILPVMFATLALSVCPFSAFAGGSDGGEHSIGGLPVDISGVATTGRAHLISDPAIQIPAYQTDIVPLLTYLENTVPDFATALKSALKKKWYFSDQDLGPCSGGTRMVDVVQVTRACQNKFKVILDRKWLMNDSTDSQGKVVSAELKQKITLVHEMLRNLTLTNPDIDEDNLEYVVRLLLDFEGKLPDENTLSLKLEQLGFGTFMTSSLTRKLKISDERWEKLSVRGFEAMITLCDNEAARAEDSGRHALALQIEDLRQQYGIGLFAAKNVAAGYPPNCADCQN